MDNQQALTEIQKQFSLMKLNGDYSVLDNEEIQSALSGQLRGDIGFFEGQHAKTLLKRYLQTLPIPSNAKTVIDDFWLDPNTLEYTQTAFCPTQTPASTLNFWTGHTVSPGKGDCNIIKDFIRHVVCCGDNDSYIYLMNFLAHMLQKPEEKPGICIVLIGGQGVGKGVFFQLLAHIWGATTLRVSDIDQVIGRFNAALERNYVVCMDEALFAGDKKSLNRLKSVVTEPEIRIEQKYQPSRTIDSYQRFFAATNHEQFAHMEHDDRRFLFLRVSDQHKQDTEYFGNLHKSLQDGKTVEAFVYDLLHYSLSDFDVRTRPQTGEHLRQRLQSLEHFERYWYEVLKQGETTWYECPTTHWNEPVFVPTDTLVQAYKHANRNAERYATVQVDRVVESLKKICPSATKHRATDKGGGGRKRGYALPYISEARKDFERHLGCKIDWD